MELASRALSRAKRWSFYELPQEPEPGLVKNSAMTAEQLETATGFVNNLIDLGVLQKPTEPLKNNFPLFLVEKSVKGR